MDADIERMTAQFEAPPQSGIKRFWMGIESWLEDWPGDAPFFFWQTGSGCEYRLRPSMAGTEEARDLPQEFSGFGRLASEVVDQMYVSNGTLTMLVDAPDQDAAWAIVRAHFPDMRERFISAADGKTLTSLGRGRFEHPSAGENHSVDPAPTP